MIEKLLSGEPVTVAFMKDDIYILSIAFDSTKLLDLKCLSLVLGLAGLYDLEPAVCEHGTVYFITSSYGDIVSVVNAIHEFLNEEGKDDEDVEIVISS